MKRLWAPWRIEYILDKKKNDSCLFCDVSKTKGTRADSARDRKNMVLYRSTCSFVMLNRYPYNSGHLMVVPYVHTPDFGGLSDDVLFDLMKTVDRSVSALREALSPDGFNVGLNMGKVAGAGMESHMHIHVVPRWTGDTDSMPIIGETRVIPEHLKKTYDKILKIIRK